jgi:enterochelin esterase-like enzyme
MGLTSGSFGTLMFILAAAGVVAVIALWPRAARQRPVTMLARVGMIGVSQLLVIAAFLVYLNSYFGFYASWSQLLGSGTTPVVRVAKAAGPSQASVVVTGAAPAPVPGGAIAKTTTHIPVAEGHGNTNLIGQAGGKNGLQQTGELLQVNITGQHSGIAVMKDFVYLPPQYFQPAYAHAKFPAVLALTGYPGSSWSIVSRLKLPAEQESLVRAGKARPAVIVMMNASVAMPRDTECTDIPAGLQVETFFAQDVPAAIEHAFRVQGGPGSWAALGYSTGGFCAVKLAMMNPRQFTYAISLAGYYQALMDRTTGNLYGGNLGYEDENSPDWRLQHLPAPAVSVLVTSSKVGERTYGGTLQFVALVKPPMQVFTLYLPQGGHNFATWGRELPQALMWLSARLSPAVPGAGTGAGGTTGPPSPGTVTGSGSG